MAESGGPSRHASVEQTTNISADPHNPSLQIQTQHEQSEIVPTISLSETMENNDRHTTAVDAPRDGNLQALDLQAQILSLKAQLDLLTSRLEDQNNATGARMSHDLGQRRDGTLEVKSGRPIEEMTSQEGHRSIPEPHPEDTWKNDQPFESDAERERHSTALQRQVVNNSMPIVPELRYVGWDDFKTVYISAPTYAIDVLLGPPDFSGRLPPMRERDGDKHDLEESEEIRNSPEIEHLQKAQREMPDRIRINSNKLADFLGRLCGEFEQLRAPIVLLRPYKLLLRFEEAIRGEFQKLLIAASGSVTHDNTAKLNGDEPNKANRENRQLSVSEPLLQKRESEDLLKLLGCLVKFLDTEVTPLVKSCRQSTLERIHYGDLWNLYKPGDLVVSTHDLKEDRVYRPTAQRRAEYAIPFPMCDEVTSSSQTNVGYSPPIIWRVLHVSRGRTMYAREPDQDGRMQPQPPPPGGYHRNPNKASTGVRRWSLRVLCYRIIFDGDMFGPIGHVFEIPSFDGEKEVASLDPVPARYSSAFEATRAKLLSQGQKFTAYTSPVHRFYAGTILSHYPSGLRCALSHNSGSTEGHVIVDFKKAAQDSTEWILASARGRPPPPGMLPFDWEGPDREIFHDYCPFTREEKKKWP